MYLSVVFGIMASILTMGAVYSGEEDKKSLKILYKITLKYGLMVTLFITVVVLFFAEKIVMIYLPNSPEAVPETVTALSLYIISVPLYLIGGIYKSLSRVLRQKILSTVICAMEDFGFVVLFAYLLGYSVGLHGVWISFLLGEIATLIFIFCAICKHCGHFPRTLDDLLMLPKDFDLSMKERFRVTVTNIEEVMKASEDVRKFLLEQGTSERNAYIMALAVEELAGNIIRWSFKSAQKNTITFTLSSKMTSGF